MIDLLDVVVRKRTGTVYTGQVLRISSINEVGPFDIYPHHAQFVTVIKQRLEIAKETGKPATFDLDRGILRVKANNVEIYLGI